MTQASPATPPVIHDYELLRRIGQGSYGDVWLARGITGIHRAVKVVWRDRFENAEPFEREFRGLRDFASFSVKADGQMALLHIGRNDAAGIFYYVMELADDASQQPVFDPATYVPLTLKEWRQRKGRVPAPEVIAAGAELATALAALHAAGLVHRDIKPSNVILVNGRAKLADIGLVAAADDARTFIGTMGYVPPEGPGSPAADVWALGRVLYELVTGLEGDQFPKLPDGLGRAPDRKELFKLNEVLLCACAATNEGRYADAAGLAADLVALREGGTRCSRTGRRRWLGAVAALAIGLLVWWQLRPATILLSPAPRPAEQAVAPNNSIAMLPFENLSDEKANAYFASGLQEDLLTNLAGIRALKVVSRESASRYRGTTKSLKQVGAELGARYILSGSVRRDARVVLVTAQLIDAQADQQVWARRYERELSQALTLQTVLADEIISALKPTLAPGERAAATKEITTSAAAYDLYLKAKRAQDVGFTDPEGIDVAEDRLRQALALDPNFVRAWLALAFVHRWHYFNDGTDPTPERLAKIEQAIGEARRLAPDAPEVLIGLAQIRDYCYKDNAGAEALFRQVLASHPDYPDPDLHRSLAFLYRRTGRWTEALAENRETWRMNPDSPFAAMRYVELLIVGRRYSEAREWLKTLRHSWPDNRDARFNLALDSFIVDESEAELERWLAGIPADQRETPRIINYEFQWAFTTGNERKLLDLVERRGLSWNNLDAGSLLLHRGERERLRIYLDKMKPEFDEWVRTESRVAPCWVKVAKYLALRGDRAEALAAIDRARQFKVESFDVWNGRREACELVDALVWLGEKDAALAEIERLAKLPQGFSGWDLRHYITFISLHDDPRYQAIVADPATNAPLF